MVQVKLVQSVVAGRSGTTGIQQSYGLRIEAVPESGASAPDAR